MLNFDVFKTKFAYDVYKQKYAMNGNETWRDTCKRVATEVMGAIGLSPNHELTKEVEELIYLRWMIPGGRYLRSAGRPVHNIKNCICFGVEDTAEAWSKHLYKTSLSLMYGMGIGGEYSKCRGKGSPLKSKGGYASGPVPLMKMTDMITGEVMSGGDRRGAELAQLAWHHPDIFDFITAKDWPPEILAGLQKNWNSYAPLKYTNLSVRLGDEFLKAYNSQSSHAHAVFDATINRMVRTGEPGFICNFGDKKKDIYTNACSEYRSDKDSATCNLVAPNWAKIPNLTEFKRVIEIASLLAVAGNRYTYYPLERSSDIALEDNDIGIGAMGMASWFAQRGYKYGEESKELHDWLAVYADNISMVKPYCDKLGLKTPKRGRAIAPTGSISILGETSGGLEPIYCVSYKRKVLKDGVVMMSEYVIDPVARDLIDLGVSPDAIEDAFSISYERRIAFQATVQDYVDMGISSTINLPKWGSETNNEDTTQEFKRVVLRYLPRLRGLTVFPDGSRGSAQPLTPIKYETAVKYAGKGLVEDSIQVCDLRGGNCGNA